MAKPYLTQRDCAMRVDSTLCTYAGKPVWVRADEREPANHIHINDVSLWIKGTGKPKKILIEDPLFSVTPVELGYVNLQHTIPQAVYLYRQAQRRPRQGLSTDNINIVGNTLGVDLNALLSSKEFVDMWCGVYPSFSECLDSVLKAPEDKVLTDKPARFKPVGKARMAFHKHLCLSGKKSDTVVDIEMQGRLLGTYCPRNARIVIDKNILQDETDKSTQVELLVIMLNNNGVKINDYILNT